MRLIACQASAFTVRDQTELHQGKSNKTTPEDTDISHNGKAAGQSSCEKRQCGLK